MLAPLSLLFFFFNDTATTEIYTLSLHDALPIYQLKGLEKVEADNLADKLSRDPEAMLGTLTSEELVSVPSIDRKSTRLNSSHSQISYAVFCLKKKKKSKHNLTELYAAILSDSHI